MLSTFLKTHPIENGTPIKTIIKNFRIAHPNNPATHIHTLLESHGHVISDDIIVTTNESKMREFLQTGYLFESLGKFAHDYRLWRNVPFKNET
jgi:hypothetical protein